MPRRNNRRIVEEDDDDDDDEDDIDIEELGDDEDDDDEDDDDPLEHLPDYVIKRVEKLQELHTQRETLMEQYVQERALLEKKFELLLKPIYTDRSMIVQGLCDNDEIVDDDKVDDTTTTIPATVSSTIAAAATTTTATSEDPTMIQEVMSPTTSKGAVDMTSAPNDDTTNNADNDETIVVNDLSEHNNNNNNETSMERVKGIPQFWACTMTRVEAIGETITVDDLSCLEHLIDISCTYHDDGKGFTLTFDFEPNEYFSNTSLTKTYIVPNLLVSDDEPMIQDVKGTAIHWKTNMSLTHKTVKKKQRGKGKNAGQVRSVTKLEEKESFFHWFTPPDIPSNERSNDLDEEEVEQLEELVEADYEIAQAFRCHIIPNAILAFTGQGTDGTVERVVVE